MLNSGFLPFRLAALFLTIAVRSNAQTNVLEDMNWQPEAVTNVADAATLWFPIGERLTYSIHWGIFHVANTVISTDWVRWHDDRLLVRIRYRTVNNRVIAKFYPVNDTLDSYIDPSTFLPVRFVKILNEGRYHNQTVTDFNHTAGTARWRKDSSPIQDWTLPISADTRDIPSFLYWLRKDAFPVGVTNRYKVMADEQLYDLILSAADRHFAPFVPGFGPVASLELVPEASFEGLFVRKQKLTAWVSKGAPCLITRMDAEVPVARIRILLAKIEGASRNAWTNVWNTASQSK